MSNATVAFATNGEHIGAFAVLVSAVQRLAKLPLGDDLSISAATSKTAVDMISKMSGRAIEPPKLLPFGEEALVLTWERGAIKRYLKINGDDVYELLYERTKDIRCESEWDLLGEDRWRRLDEIIGSTPVSQTAQL